QHCRPLIERTKSNSKNSDILADVVSPLERVHQQDRAETVPLISTKDRKGSDVNGGKISVRDVVSLVVEELIRFLDFYCKRVEPVGSMSIPRLSAEYLHAIARVIFPGLLTNELVELRLAARKIGNMMVLTQNGNRDVL